MIKYHLKTPVAQTALLTAVLLFFQTLVFTSVLPQYIPSWTWILRLWVLFSYALIFFIGFRLYIQVRILLQEQVKSYLYLPFQIFLALGLITWFALGGILTWLFTGQGLFGGQHASTHPFPEYHKTIYIIDASIVDPLTRIMIQDSVWPVMSPVYFFPNYLPQEIKLEQKAHLLTFSSKREKIIYDLKAGKLAEKTKLFENLESWDDDYEP